MTKDELTEAIEAVGTGNTMLLENLETIALSLDSLSGDGPQTTSENIEAIAINTEAIADALKEISTTLKLIYEHMP